MAAAAHGVAITGLTYCLESWWWSPGGSGWVTSSLPSNFSHGRQHWTCFSCTTNQHRRWTCDPSWQDLWGVVSGHGTHLGGAHGASEAAAARWAWWHWGYSIPKIQVNPVLPACTAKFYPAPISLWIPNEHLGSRGRHLWQWAKDIINQWGLLQIISPGACPLSNVSRVHWPSWDGKMASGRFGPGWFHLLHFQGLDFNFHSSAGIVLRSMMHVTYNQGLGKFKVPYCTSRHFFFEGTVVHITCCGSCSNLCLKFRFRPLKVNSNHHFFSAL